MNQNFLNMKNQSKETQVVENQFISRKEFKNILFWGLTKLSNSDLKAFILCADGLRDQMKKLLKDKKTQGFKVESLKPFEKSLSKKGVFSIVEALDFFLQEPEGRLRFQISQANPELEGVEDEAEFFFETKAARLRDQFEEIVELGKSAVIYKFLS